MLAKRFSKLGLGYCNQICSAHAFSSKFRFAVKSPQKELKVDEKSEYKMQFNDDDYREMTSRTIVDDSRYVSINDRTDTTCLPQQRIIDLQLCKQNNYFGESLILKDPFDEVILRQIVCEVKPKTIFEFGTFTGTSAAYMDMVCKYFGLNDTRILTYDINGELRDKSLDQDNIEYYVCDLTNIDKIESFSIENLKNYAHPWLVIEDSHVNIINILNHFDEHGFKSGDYIIVEDTIPGIPGEDKMIDLRKWLVANESKGYMVDTKYCDQWGYNSTWNCNGYIRKIN